MPITRQIALLGQPVLRMVADQVPDPGVPAIQKLVEEMLVTVREVNGVGLAAPQLFESLSLFVVASGPNPRYPDAPEMEPVVVVNPEILWVSDEVEEGWEGCLSITGVRGLVPRHVRIGVRYLTGSGETREEEFAGFPARVFQHEYDHLMGVVLTDRVESPLGIVTEEEYLRRPV